MTDSIPNSENADDSPQDSPTLPSDAPASPSDLDSPTEDFDLVLNEGEILEEAIESEQELSQPEPELVFSGSESFAIRRMQRKEPSFLKKVVPPILGGLAAFPIATAIMWYGLGKDIGSTAPFVAKYVPWIVPAKLRGTTFRSDGTFGGVDHYGVRIELSGRPHGTRKMKATVDFIGKQGDVFFLAQLCKRFYFG